MCDILEEVQNITMFNLIQKVFMNPLMCSGTIKNMKEIMKTTPALKYFLKYWG